MKEEGHEILFTARDKDLTILLLMAYNLPYISLGKTKKGLLSKILGLFYFEWKLLKVARKFKPDYLLSHGSIYAAHISFMIGRPHISFEDTGNMEQITWYKAFTDVILISDSFTKDLGRKAITYPGYHELAYLHPNRFIPNLTVLDKYRLDPNQNIILLRFVSWNATHDINHQGISPSLKIEAATTFSQYGHVLISSESELADELKPYEININPTDIFDLMAHCKLVFGESGTMSSEAAVLGVPAIFIDSTSREYTQEQEKKYGLVYNFSESPADIRRAIHKGVQILSEPKSSNKYKQRQEKLLEDKIDVTGFLKEFVLNFEKYCSKISPPAT